MATYEQEATQVAGRGHVTAYGDAGLHHDYKFSKAAAVEPMSLRDQSLTEQLETVTATIRDCHAIVGLLEGQGEGPSEGGPDVRRGVFSLTGEALAGSSALRERLQSIRNRIGSL